MSSFSPTTSWAKNAKTKMATKNKDETNIVLRDTSFIIFL
jgi:hypothetical protein